jgi:hypothetical protein
MLEDIQKLNCSRGLQFRVRKNYLNTSKMIKILEK